MSEILYSLVATEDTLLIEANRQSSSSKYVHACRKILKKITRHELRRPDGMATLLSGSYAYNYIHGCETNNQGSVLESLIFLCVTEALPYAATPNETRETAFTYLTNIRRSFLEQFRDDLNILCKNNSFLKNNNNNNNNNNNINDDASIDSNMIINIDNQMKSDLRRFAGYMKDEMDAHSTLQKNVQEEEKEDDDNDLNINNKDDNDEKKYDDNNNNNNNNNYSDLRRGPPPSGHPLYQPSKVDRVVNQIDALKNNVKQSIEMVIDRGEELSLLQGKADEFSKESMSFRNRSRSVQYHYCRELYKQRCIIVFVVIFTIYLFSAWICGWDWDSCSN